MLTVEPAKEGPTSTSSSFTGGPEAIPLSGSNKGLLLHEKVGQINKT